MILIHAAIRCVLKQFQVFTRVLSLSCHSNSGWGKSGFFAGSTDERSFAASTGPSTAEAPVFLNSPRMIYYHRAEDPTERMFDRLSQNPDVERGLQKIANNPNTDPEILAMARAVTTECEHARKRRENNTRNAVLAVIAAFVIMFFIFLFLKAITH